MRSIVRLSLLPLAVTLVAACQDRPSPMEPGGISALLSDGAHHGGNPDFFFLPPLAGDPTSNPNFTAGQFNRRLRPVMAVFKGTDQCSLTNVKRKVFGPVSVPVSSTEEMYKLDWNTSVLKAGTQYRLCIFGSAAGKSLGFVDLAPVSNVMKNIQIGDVVKFQVGRVLPVKFRIEFGALSYDPSQPAAVGTEFTVDKAGGSVTLRDATGTKFLAAVSVPANAVQQGTVTVVVATEAPKFDDKCLPTVPIQSNGCYQIRTEPELFPFAQLVRVEICVDPSPVATSLRDSLRVFKFNTTQGLVALQPADPTLIGTDCSGSGLGLNDAAPLRGREGVILQLARWAGRLVAPRELHAAVRRATTPPKGIGGLVGSFSDFGGAVPALADLTIGDLTVSPAYPASGDILSVSGFVSNSGGAAAGPSTVSLCIVQGFGGSCAVFVGPGVPAGDSAPVSATIGAFPGGTYTITASVDTFDVVPESNETNNQTIGPTFTVSGWIATQVSAGGFHTCARKGDGTAACWGAESSSVNFGQATPPEGTFSQVSAGQYHTCALKPDATIECWGSTTGSLSAPADSFIQVSAGGQHTCGVKVDATVECGGANEFGQSTPPSGTFTQVSAGLIHTCAVRTDGTVACWGDDFDGAATPPAGTFTQVSAGQQFACGLKADGTVACWGDPASGKTTPPGGTFTQVSAGGNHACGLRADGTVACWGSNYVGAEYAGQATPPAGTFTQVSAGNLHTCAIASTGRVVCWGWDADGQATPPLN